MARLGRSQPVNWLLTRRPASHATPGLASLPAGVSLQAGGSVTASAVLPLVTQIGPAAIPPATGEMDASVTLVAGGSLAGAAVLPIEADLEAVPNAWVFTGSEPTTYPQYLGAGGTLDVTPGQAIVSIAEASGWPYSLPVPPADGRWATLGGGLMTLERAEEETAPADPLAWDPPEHLAFLPVPFDVIARRIEARQR